MNALSILMNGARIFEKNNKDAIDRKSVVQGKSVDLGGRRIIKKKKTNKQIFG